MNIDQQKGLYLMIGTFGIYLIYCVASILQQWIMKMPYTNRFTQQTQTFESAQAFVLMPSLVAWFNGKVLNWNNKPEKQIPAKNLIICSAIIIASTVSFTQAIYVTNFPIVMMFKSCNVLSVITVAIFCSRVTDKRQKLGIKKMISGLFISLGILIYNFSGPQSHSEKATKPWGIILLLISLICDGFLPDFQAEIKVNYNPTPLEFFEQTNKYKTLLAFALCCVTLQIKTIAIFFWQHPICLVHMIGLAMMGSIGQILVFWMIKLFRQHIVPFIITTRKITTVVISIIFFGHEYKWMQIVGIMIVFLTVLIDFTIEIRKQNKPEQTNEMEQKSTQQENILSQQINQMIDDRIQKQDDQQGEQGTFQEKA